MNIYKKLYIQRSLEVIYNKFNSHNKNLTIIVFICAVILFFMAGKQTNTIIIISVLMLVFILTVLFGMLFSYLFRIEQELVSINNKLKKFIPK